MEGEEPRQTDSLGAPRSLPLNAFWGIRQQRRRTGLLGLRGSRSKPSLTAKLGAQHCLGALGARAVPVALHELEAVQFVPVQLNAFLSVIHNFPLFKLASRAQIYRFCQTNFLSMIRFF